MNVKKLINELKKYSGDMEVRLADVFEQYSCPTKVTKLRVCNFHSEHEINKYKYVLIE